MFQQLEALVRETGKVTLMMKMAGDQMSVVVMPCADSKEAALRQPLVLTATPAELDAGFVQALQSFEGAHRSLAEQVSATTEILQAAEKSQAGKAQKALSKGSKPALPAPKGCPTTMLMTQTIRNVATTRRTRRRPLTRPRPHRQVATARPISSRFFEDTGHDDQHRKAHPRVHVQRHEVCRPRPSVQSRRCP